MKYFLTLIIALISLGINAQSLRGSESEIRNYSQLEVRDSMSYYLNDNEIYICKDSTVVKYIIKYPIDYMYSTRKLYSSEEHIKVIGTDSFYNEEAKMFIYLKKVKNNLLIIFE